MESEWLTHAKRLQAIAATGVHFTADVFDRERFAEIGEIATNMLARLGEVPVERIAGLVSTAAGGYATPKVDVRGAVFEGDRILLVREQSDGRWTLPGGFADVGRSAAENIVKEVEEEAGLRVVADCLYAVRHKAKPPYEPDARDFYKLFFLCRRLDDAAPHASGETDAVAFFRPDALPPLSLGRVTPADIHAAVARQRDPHLETIFD